MSEAGAFLVCLSSLLGPSEIPDWSLSYLPAFPPSCAQYSGCHCPPCKTPGRSLVVGCTPAFPVLGGRHCLHCSLGQGKDSWQWSRPASRCGLWGWSRADPGLETSDESPPALGSGDHAMKKPRQPTVRFRGEERPTARSHSSDDSPYEVAPLGCVVLTLDPRPPISGRSVTSLLSRAQGESLWTKEMIDAIPSNHVSRGVGGTQWQVTGKSAGGLRGKAAGGLCP